MGDQSEKLVGGENAFKVQEELLLGDIVRLEDEILATENFTPEEALRLGGSYITSLKYFSLLNASKNYPASVRDNFMSRGMEGELALIKALSGDYTGIKEVLGKRGTESLDDVSQIKQREHSLGRKLLQMVAILPVQGKPFLPPLPQGVKK